MTKEAALYDFYSGFGVPAYEENSVPDGATFPYLTYQVATDDFYGGNVSLTASLWYRSTSWSAINAKTREIAKNLDVILPCDDGAIWLTSGTPFAQNMADDSDKEIKRKLINITAQYITTD
jgi:hypothetical protein